MTDAETIAELRHQLEATQKASAEMRKIIESVAELAHDFLDNQKGHFTALCQHALSCDCGKDYFSRKQVKPLLVALGYFQAATRGDILLGKATKAQWAIGLHLADEALAQVKELGL